MIVKSVGHTPIVPLGTEMGAGHELGNCAATRLAKNMKLRSDSILTVVRKLLAILQRQDCRRAQDYRVYVMAKQTPLKSLE